MTRLYAHFNERQSGAMSASSLRHYTVPPTPINRASDLRFYSRPWKRFATVRSFSMGRPFPSRTWSRITLNTRNFTLWSRMWLVEEKRLTENPRRRPSRRTRRQHPNWLCLMTPANHDCVASQNWPGWHANPFQGRRKMRVLHNLLSDGLRGSRYPNRSRLGQKGIFFQSPRKT